MLKADMIVLNYEGEQLLKEFLPSVVKAAKNSRYDCRVIVLDNQSKDDSERFVRENFKDTEFIKARENKIYCSFNEAVSGLDSDIVILLNNDMRLEKDFVDPLIDPFLHNKDVFFVASNGDKAIARKKWVILGADIDYSSSDKANNSPGYTFSAGIGAFDRKKFIELEGYDELYLPGIYEDVDLCFRGWKRGWKGLYAPGSKKYHVGAASFKEHYKQKQISKIVFRNSILFTLKNITDPIFLIQSISLTFLRTVYYFLTGRWYMVQGFFMAMADAKKALKRKEYARKNFILSDRQIVKTINRDILQDQITIKKKAVRYIKGLITRVGRDSNPMVRNVFLKLAFPMGMVFFPLEYLLIKELIECESVLDLGCGRHSMVGILPKDHYHTVGVELFKPYLDKAVESGRHSTYVCADMREINFKDNSFDAVVLLDVLEHLEKEDGLALLEKAERWARKKVILNTPNGYFEQDAYDGNELQKHLSGWEIKEFKDRGFSIKGLRGFNWMHVLLERFKLSIFLREVFVRIFNLFNFFVYFFPSTAHQLFCAKDIKNEIRK